VLQDDLKLHEKHLTPGRYPVQTICESKKTASAAFNARALHLNGTWEPFINWGDSQPDNNAEQDCVFIGPGMVPIFHFVKKF